MKNSSFHEAKNGLIEPVCKQLHSWKQSGKEVKILRMDNGGENKALVKRLNSKDWKMYPTVEYTARDTPQHNHMVEVGFATLYGRGRAMMKAANIPEQWKHVVAQKALETATKLDGLIPVKIQGVTKPRVEHWCGTVPAFAYNLRTWGEAGTVKIKDKSTPKLGDRGMTCMFVGYASDHAGDCYEMLNLKTRRILQTRDVTWLGRMYFEKSTGPNDGTPDGDSVADGTDDSDSNTESEPEEPVAELETTVPQDMNEESNDPHEAPAEQTGATTRSGRAVRAPGWMSEYSTTTIDEIMTVGAGIGGGFTHTSELRPMKYNEAMSKDPVGWNKAVDQEHTRFVSHKVWQAILRKFVPKNAKILSSTWAMKQKADGTLRARLNARGYEQKEGEHYKEDGISSPVVNEASIFMILILILMVRMYCEINDVKGAFLNGLFSGGEKLYMEVPQGFEKYYPGDVLLLLLKTIYGLKQAAFEYWKALLKAIRAIGLTRSKADPCVYFKWTDQGLMIWSSWVDDILSCGNKEEVIKGRQELKKHFDLDEVGEMKEYIGCKVEYNKEEGWMKLTQPVLVQSFEDEFELPEKPVETPAAPGSVLMGGEEGTPLLSPEKHKDYRKGVGKLIHLGKYSKAECLNAIRELSRFGSKPNEAHYKAMIRTMRYCTSTKDKGLVLKPNAKWDGKDKSHLFEVTGISDSDFAKDPESRKSISGWSVFLHGAPCIRKSKMQRFVTMSVTEAECVAAASCVQDMMYCKQFLESMELKVKLPMRLWMDNKGGVDLFNSWSIAGNTRSISVRLAYIRELKEQGILEIKWLRGEDNPVDIFTKNTDGTTFKKHAKVFTGSDEDPMNRRSDGSINTHNWSMNTHKNENESHGTKGNM
jgi:hypothetical protein